MLSLIKSKARKQDGSRAGNGKLGKRSRSLISRPIEVLTSANLNKLQQQQQQQQNLQSQVCVFMCFWPVITIFSYHIPQ